MKADIGSIHLSDHAPISLYIRLEVPHRAPFQWRLNKSLLQDTVTMAREHQIREFTVFPNYRPISLLNVDLKLFTKKLASRLALELPSLIHYDQVGFIPTREVRDGVTRVLDLLHLAKSKLTPIMLLSIDAEKAFDQDNWTYMEATLGKIGLGDRTKARIQHSTLTPPHRSK